MEEYKPFLMWDDTEKDGHAETMMDYILSWCLRSTKYQYVKDCKPILYQYCKYKIYHLYDLVDGTLNYKESESDIFNELFLREWL